MERLDRLVPFLSERPGMTGGAQNLAFDEKALDRTEAQLRAVSLRESGALGGAAAITDIAVEVLVGRSNFLPARFLDIGVDRARATCKIEASGTDFRGRQGSWAGTGFLISPCILLTNCHVLNSAAVAGSGRCIFNYQLGKDGQMMPAKSFALNPGRLYVNSPVDQLDFALVWVDGEPGKEFGFVPINRNAFQVTAGELVNIVQHPEGEPKQVALQENQLDQVLETVLRYSTDTQPGSSGSCVFNNEWQPVALHHASRVETENGNQVTRNEGIRFTAIAAHLEKLTQSGTEAEKAAAIEVLRLFNDTDALMGFFGALGRTFTSEAPGVEAVVNSYNGESADVDIAFWNVEWFTRKYEEKVAAVAEVVARMNLDIWALVESSPNATRALVKRLDEDFGLKFDAAFSEPSSADGKQSTTVIWNTRTVKGERVEWPGEIDSWFKISSKGHQPGDFADLGLEAVDGKIFDRYPGLFRFKAANREEGQDPFDFFLIPLHLKAMAEGSKRRQLASEILAAAINSAKAELGDEDWVIGGDFNAELATGDFQALTDKGLMPISAADETAGAFSYLKSPKSLIDHVFLSANLSRTFGADDYFIVAKEKTLPGYVKNLSDHRPVVVRLSLLDQAAEAQPQPSGGEVPESLIRALKDLRGGARAAGTTR